MLLKVKAIFENVQLAFLFFVFNVYAPRNALGWWAFFFFLDILNVAGKNCNENIYMFLEGDFTRTESPSLDRNHPEPHHASSSRLAQIVKSHQLCNVWRLFNSNRGQYTWSRPDHLYCFTHLLNIFKKVLQITCGF